MACMRELRLIFFYFIFFLTSNEVYDYFSVVKFVTSLSLQTPFMVPEYKIDNELVADFFC